MGKDFGPRTVYAASAYVKHQLDLYLRETDNHAEDSLTTTYETLLTNPLDFVHHFAKFSGLTVPDDVEQRLEKLNIRVTNFDKWKRWSEYDIAVSETLLRPYLERFGYEIHSPEPLKLTPAETARFRAIDIAKRIPQRLKSIWTHKILAK